MKSANGFTLIEVLIALVIIAIAMTAIIKTVGNNIRTTQYLSDKTLGYWAASNVLNDHLAIIQTVTETSDTGQIILLNKTVWWSFAIEPTNNGRIKKVIVHIYLNESKDKPIVSLVSYAS